jgi:hypothetical protein
VIDWKKVEAAIDRCFDEIDRAGLSSNVFSAERWAMYTKLRRLREKYDQPEKVP